MTQTASPREKKVLGGSRLLIDGQLRASSSGATYVDENPATEEELCRVPDGNAEDMNAAVWAARTAFDSGTWANDAEFRSHCLRQLHEALSEAKDELRAGIVAETGAPVALASTLQLDWPLTFFERMIDIASGEEWEQELVVGSPEIGTGRRLVRREPAGVVSVITPWNYPLYLNVGKVGTALAAGCTVVLKPAIETPWNALALGEIIATATDIPPGVVNVVSTQDNGAAEILTTHPAVDAVTFTGSTSTGRRIAANAAATIKRTTLELGGKSAAVLLNDADLDRFVPIYASAACRHAGQGCGLNTRLLVPRRDLNTCVDLAQAAMESVPYGDPTDPNNVMGPVISARQKERVLAMIDAAKPDGGLVSGGGPASQFDRGYFIQPTLFADIDPGSQLAQEEVFGPVLVILPYDSIDHAVELANGTIYGLSGAVVGRDVDRALEVARRLRTGTVSINESPWIHPDSPFGGYKQSGIGREWGIEGLRDFTEIKTIGLPRGER